MVAFAFAAFLVWPAPLLSVNVRKVGRCIEFRLGGELVTAYHIAPENAKPYLWPLVAPTGVGVTRDWPLKPADHRASTDHPHQKSAWFGHGEIRALGPGRDPVVVDFWHERPGDGRIVCTAAEVDRNGVLRTENEWRTAGGEVLMQEARNISLVPRAGGRLLVVRHTFRAKVLDVEFGDTKEGALAVRVDDRLRATAPGSGRIRNADGKDGEMSCWGRKSDWCDYSGQVDGQRIGVAIFDDPTNPSRACWHVRGYGLLAANPFGRRGSGFPSQLLGAGAPVRLAAGKSTSFRYGLLIHNGEADQDTIAEHYQAFVACTRD